MELTTDTGQRLELLEMVFESLKDAVVVYDKSGAILYANKAAAIMGEFNSVEEMLATPQEDALKRIVILGEDMRPVKEERFTARRAGEGVPNEKRTVMIRGSKTGNYRWLAVSSSPVVDANSGEVLFIVTIASDITEQKVREDKLSLLIESAKVLSLREDFEERLQRKAQLMVPSLADWCIIDLLTENGTVKRVATVHSEPEKVKLLENYGSHSLDDLHKPSVVDRVLKSGVAEFYPRVTEDLMKQRTGNTEHFNLLRKMDLHSGMIIPIVSRRRVLGAISIAYAQSKRTYTQADFQFMQEFSYHLGILFENDRLFQELRERDKVKDEFLATLSHELRNPLAPIKTSLELLELKNTDKDVGSELAVIKRQFNHMTSLLNDLLDATRFTQGKIHLDKKLVELSDIVRHTANISRAYINNKKIRFDVSVPTRPILLFADETRLEQVLTNILHNAEKFTPSGGYISLSLEAKDGWAILTVKDDGIGIAQKDLSRIFDLHYQVQGKLGEVNAGLGIGLVLVKEIVRLHGGEVDAYSDGLGRGSTFVVRLPLTEVAKQEPQEPRSRPRHGSISKKVFVIDDNHDAADSLTKLLGALGSDATAVHSGKETLLLLDHGPRPDVFIIDINMPGMNGYELLGALRERGFREPMIALTGYGMEEDKQRMSEAGFNHLLTKPVSIEELRSILS